MSLPRIRLETCEPEGEGLWRLDPPQARHLVKSLRSYDGAAVEGLLEDGGRKLLMKLERRGVRCFLREVSSESEPPDGLEITLLIGILKADQFDAVLKASSEVGVKLVLPVFCERSVPRITASETQKKISRWQKILDEGASVTGSPFHPKIAVPKHFGEIDWNALPENRFAAIISPDARPISDAVCRAGELVYAVGPEGDWSDAERASLLAGSFIPVTLGRRIMRASTAAITGCAWFRFQAGFTQNAGGEPDSPR